LHEHLEALEQRGLLRRIDKPIDKDAEMHPLVRWQFRRWIDEAERKAFLFTNITTGSAANTTSRRGRPIAANRKSTASHARAARRHPGQMGSRHRQSDRAALVNERSVMRW